MVSCTLHLFARAALQITEHCGAEQSVFFFLPPDTSPSINTLLQRTDAVIYCRCLLACLLAADIVLFLLNLIFLWWRKKTEYLGSGCNLPCLGCWHRLRVEGGCGYALVEPPTDVLSDLISIVGTSRKWNLAFYLRM